MHAAALGRCEYPSAQAMRPEDSSSLGEVHADVGMLVLPPAVPSFDPSRSALQASGNKPMDTIKESLSAATRFMRRSLQPSCQLVSPFGSRDSARPANEPLAQPDTRGQAQDGSMPQTMVLPFKTTIFVGSEKDQSSLWMNFWFWPCAPAFHEILSSVPAVSSEALAPVQLSST